MPDPISIPEVPSGPLEPKAKLKIPAHPQLREKLDQALEAAFEAKYEKEQAEAKRAGGRR
jgi:hypothetical protein